jgi:hypothetical protein
MITKVSVLYVGQIELENVGLQGRPADDRRYPNERIVEAYRTSWGSTVCGWPSIIFSAKGMRSSLT